MIVIEVRGRCTTLNELERLCETAREHYYDGDDAVGFSGERGELIIQHEVK